MFNLYYLYSSTQLCSQQLNAANVIPLLRETQFTLYEELAALATSDSFPETAEAINTFVFETLWVGEASLAGRLQTIMNSTSAALKAISDQGENVGYATVNSVLIEASNQVRTLDVEQAALLIGAARHLIGVKEEIKRMPEVVDIAMVDFRARAEALNMTTVAVAFDETLAGLDWRFDVDRRDWSWNALDENEQVFLETLQQDPLGTFLTIQRSLEERDDVNQVAAEARQLWESLSTEILPSAIGQVVDYEIPDWNRASEALMTAFMSSVTGTPISSK